MAATPMLRPLGTGEILDAGIKLYLRHWKVLVTCVVGIVLPVRIVNAILVASANPGAFTAAGTLRSTRSLTTGELVAELIVLVLLSVTTLLATAACFKAVADAWLGAEPAAGRSLRYATRRMPALLGMSLLLSLVMALLTLLLVLPGVWFFVSSILAIPVLLFERVGPWRSIRRSVGLVRGRWWATFGTLVVGYLVAGVVGGVVTAVIEIVPRELTDSSLALAVANVVGSTIGSMLTTPFGAAVITLLYFDRRVRKEGFDLQLLAEGLGGAGLGPDMPLPAPMIDPEITPEQRAAAPYWPPPPGWKPPEAGPSRRWLPPEPPRSQQ